MSGRDGTLTATYDYLGRRSTKTVGGQTSTYLYDGQNLVADTTSATYFLYGPGIDEPLAMSTGGFIYYYCVDGLGSVTLLNGTNGAVKNSYVLDAWGNTKGQTTTVSSPFTYTASEGADVGLLYYRARYYNPSIGRFISEDPLREQGIVAGLEDMRPNSIDVYAYVRNRPMDFLDPQGYGPYFSPTRGIPIKGVKVIFDGWCPWSKESFRTRTDVCRDGPGTGAFHQGQTCYRKVTFGGRSAHICFNDSGEGCDFHVDYTGPCWLRNDDGSCNVVACYMGPGIMHGIVDVMQTANDDCHIPPPKCCHRH